MDDCTGSRCVGAPPLKRNLYSLPSRSMVSQKRNSPARAIVWIFILWIVVTDSSCSNSIRRTIRIVLDEPHPWEAAAHTGLWYTLVWHENGTLFRRHVVYGESPEISIPLGKTVVFCAYPLGELSPYANAWTPAEESGTLLLTQKYGALGDLCLRLVQGDAPVIEALDFPALGRYLLSRTEDLRLLDMDRLALDMLNGSLGEDSVHLVEKIEVPLEGVPSGRWVGDVPQDGAFWVGAHEGAVRIQLSPGYHHYLCAGRQLEAVVVVEGAYSFLTVRKCILT